MTRRRIARREGLSPVPIFTDQVADQSKREFVDHSRPSSGDRASPANRRLARHSSIESSGHQSAWSRPREKSLTLDSPPRLLFAIQLSILEPTKLPRVLLITAIKPSLSISRTKGSVESRETDCRISRIVAVSRKTVIYDYNSPIRHLDIASRFLYYSFLHLQPSRRTRVHLQLSFYIPERKQNKLGYQRQWSNNSPSHISLVMSR